MGPGDRARERPGDAGARSRTSAAFERRVVENLIEAFWPGSFDSAASADGCGAGFGDSGACVVGVRMPGHPVALELIERAGVPVAAPSANRFGRTSPTTAAHVLEDLDGRIDAVLDGGATTVGVESTVIGPAEDGLGWVVYRPGGVSLEMLERVLGVGAVQVFQSRRLWWQSRRVCRRRGLGSGTMRQRRG